MPITLAFDATAGRCAVGIFRDSALIAERVETMERGHAERLFPLFEACLEEAGLAPHDLDLIAVCTGPGNFTGARIGVAAARGLALSTGAVAIGVDRLEALAHGTSDPVAVALEARGGAIHLARFQDGALIGEAATVQADGVDLAGARLIGDGAFRFPNAEVLGASGDAPLAAIAAIAEVKAAAGAPRPAPRYLRPVNAALPSEPPPKIIG
ncbi:MAG: tRNA (adenosine(37)-N6)-threonylcarbamoyltransferase complex dimerization subunit type 1 TsaB [Pseudomonadota bacterium]